MIKGIGIDIIEIKQVENLMGKQPRFIERILTSEENKIFERLESKRKIEFLAGRFAAKEAFSKAMGTGIGKVSFKDIEILKNENNQPLAYSNKFQGNIFVSISHTDTYACAQIILEDIDATSNTSSFNSHY